MEYEVFLVSQLQQHVHAGKENKRTVVSMLVPSAPLFAAAALIMVFVFASFLPNGNPAVKQFGGGRIVAVILGATVVLCLNRPRHRAPSPAVALEP
jgi:putative drug exporter of the RND superfamily